MTKPITFTVTMISTLFAHVSFYTGIGLAIINVVWLLVKDEILFTWTYPIIAGVIFIVSIIIVVAGTVLLAVDSDD